MIMTRNMFDIVCLLIVVDRLACSRFGQVRKGGCRLVQGVGERIVYARAMGLTGTLTHKPSIACNLLEADKSGFRIESSLCASATYAPRSEKTMASAKPWHGQRVTATAASTRFLVVCFSWRQAREGAGPIVRLAGPAVVSALSDVLFRNGRDADMTLGAPNVS